MLEFFRRLLQVQGSNDPMCTATDDKVMSQCQHAYLVMYELCQWELQQCCRRGAMVGGAAEADGERW